MDLLTQPARHQALSTKQLSNKKFILKSSILSLILQPSSLLAAYYYLTCLKNRTNSVRAGLRIEPTEKNPEEKRSQKVQMLPPSDTEEKILQQILYLLGERKQKTGVRPIIGARG